MLANKQIQIFKIGGKILENEKHLDNVLYQLKVLHEKFTIKNIILIPGGGSFANFIRVLDENMNLGEELSHWMAIYSMEFNGMRICGKYKYLTPIRNFKKIKKKTGSLFSVFLPYNFLKINDELPHKWEVTSDSISLFLAYKLNLEYCFLIKDIDGIFNFQNNLINKLNYSQFKNLKSNQALARINDQTTPFKKSKPIDSYLFTLINKYEINCYILNGKSNSDRILEFFDDSRKFEEKICTKLTYE